MEIPGASQNQRVICQFGFIANGLSFFIDDVGLCKYVGADALARPIVISSPMVSVIRSSATSISPS